MQDSPYFLFPPFRLDLANERLWHGSRTVPLRPKPFAVLRYLVEHADHLVTKEELLSAVWPGTYVSETVPRVYIRELREVLGDNPAAPQFIETVPGRGYRFIAPLSTAPMQNVKFKMQSASASPLYPFTPASPLVGREAELVQLYGWLAQALAGERQVVFVTGEAGIGKTAVVEALVEKARGDYGLWIGRGQCIEHHGAGEAYLPVLEALGQLCRGPASPEIIELLDRYAPTWLVQMPWLINVADRERLQRTVIGATRERMLREMAETLEALTARTPLVLWLEDLQGSDYSTLDLIAFLARRQGPARLLLIGTYRPVDINVSGHPLKTLTQDLQVRRQGKELRLEFLTEKAVEEYLLARFDGGVTVDSALRSPDMGEGQSPLGWLAHLIHQRTDGNPLFMVNVVDYLVAQQVIIEEKGRWELQETLAMVVMDVPESLRLMIERQIEGLNSEERQILEAASVAGIEFSAAVIAAVLAQEVEEVEEHCETLTRRGQFLRAIGVEEWSDGTVTARYRFIHSLYHSILYDRVTAARRARWHRHIGEREETGYGHRVEEITTELAMHFERGRDYQRTVHYLRLAGEKAIRQHAYHEAIIHLNKGLQFLTMLPDTSERHQQEIALQIALGGQLMATKGWGAMEVERVCTRARELCQQIGDTPQLFPVLHGLCRFYSVRPDLPTTCELAEQLMALAQRESDPALLLEAHWIRGFTSFILGDLRAARADLEQGITLYDISQHSAHSLVYGQDPGVSCGAFAAAAAWFLGYPDQAVKKGEAASLLARDLAHPFAQAIALSWTAIVHQLRREERETQEKTEAALKLAGKEGFSFFSAWGTLLQGWAMAEQDYPAEGIVRMQQGLAALQAAGAEVFRPYFLALLAQAYEKAGLIEEGLDALAEALTIVENNGECLYEAELYRLKGQLTLQSQV